MARKPGTSAQGPEGASLADPPGSSWWLLPETGLPGPRRADPASPRGQRRGCGARAAESFRRGTAGGVPAAKPGGGQPRGVAPAGLWEVASRGSRLKPKQGHGVRVRGLSEPFSPQGAPTALRPGFRRDGNDSGSRIRMPVLRTSKGAHLLAAPQIHGQGKPWTGSQAFLGQSVALPSARKRTTFQSKWHPRPPNPALPHQRAGSGAGLADSKRPRLWTAPGRGARRARAAWGRDASSGVARGLQQGQHCSSTAQPS